MANDIELIGPLDYMPSAAMAGPAPHGQGAGSAMGGAPRILISTLRRWWKPALALGVILGSAAAGVGYAAYRPTFEAATWLRIRPSYLVFEHKEDRNVFVQTQRELIKSPPVITEALSNPDIVGLPVFKDVEDKVQWLSKEIIAKPVGSSELFLISLQSEHRDSVAPVVNAVRDAYLATLNTEVARQNESTLSLLEAERSRRYVEIQNDRDRLRQLAKESGVHIPSISDKSTAPPTTSPVDALQQQLSQAEVELIIYQAEFQAYKDSVNGDDVKVDSESIHQEVESNARVITLLAELERNREDLTKLEAVVPPTSKRLEQLKEAIDKTEQRLSDVRQELAPAASTALMEKAKRSRETEVEKRGSRIEQMVLMVDTLKDKLTEARKEFTSQGQSSLEMQFLQEDLARKEGVYSRIVDRIETIKTESRAQSRVTTLQEAIKPVRPVDSWLLPLLAVGAVAGLCLPFGGFLLWEFRHQPVINLEDLSHASRLRVFGEVSALPVRPKLLAPSRKFLESVNRFEESIDYLRASLLMARRGDNVQSLVICSAGPREGKSTLSAHLATSLAQGSVGRVLLVDADMRRPTLHRLLEQELDNGLCDYLAGGVEIEDIIRETQIDGLDFIPAGVLQSPASTLLTGDRFESFLRQVEEQYVFVIIDVPPILPVSDGLVIARYAKAAVFCALRDVSTAENIAKACHKLKAAGVNVIGAVFNGVPASQYGSSFQDYYRSPDPREAAQRR